MKNLNLKPGYLVILIAMAIKLVLQLIATANSGYHGDELLHIEAGKHLATGYLDFPPLIGLLSWFQNLFHSDSLYVHHLFCYLNSLLIILFCGLITLQLRGGLLALIITESAILFSPGLGVSQYLFLPTGFEQLFWVLIIYYTTVYSSTQNTNNLLYISIFAALGFLTKYSISFLFAGFVVSILLFNRKILRKRITWIALLIFILLILPNLIWQIRNEFPVFHHMSELYKTQLDKQSFKSELTQLVMFLNPATLILWLPALFVVPFHPKYKTVRLPTFTLFFACLFLLLSKGKSYYFFPILLSLFPFGAVFFEQLIQKRKWIGYAYLFVLITLGSYLLPYGLPILKLHKYIETYHLEPNQYQKIPLPFENYYFNKNWDRILPSVAKTYNTLTPEEQQHCYIWGRHYSMAGAINLLGHDYNLPYAFSFHSSFYTWVPSFDKNIVVIAISESNLDHSYWEQYFNTVKEVDVIDNPYASNASWYNYRIFTCRDIKFNSEELKQLFRDSIF